MFPELVASDLKPSTLIRFCFQTLSSSSAVQKHFSTMHDYGLPQKQEEPEVVPLNTMFEAYCRMDPLSDAMNVSLLPLSQLDKWLASAKILDMSRLTTTETGLLFFKFRKRAISYDEFLDYLNDLTSSKSLDIADVKKKMQTCGKPVHARDIKLGRDKK